MRLFTSPQPVRHAVCGEEHNFYPLPLSTLTKLRVVAKPLAKVFALIFGTDSDVGKRVDDSSNTKEGKMQRISTIEAITPALAEKRSAERQAAADGLVDGLLNPEISRVVAMLIAESMRDSFEKKPSTPAEYDALMDAITTDSAIDIFKGIVKANEKFFAPLKGRAAGASAALKSVFASKLGQQAEQPKE